MWSNNQYSADSFEIEVTLKVTGQGRVGADGMVCMISYAFLLKMFNSFFFV